MAAEGDAPRTLSRQQIRAIEREQRNLSLVQNWRRPSA